MPCPHLSLHNTTLHYLYGLVEDASAYLHHLQVLLLLVPGTLDVGHPASVVFLAGIDEVADCTILVEYLGTGWNSDGVMQGQATHVTQVRPILLSPNGSGKWIKFLSMPSSPGKGGWRWGHGNLSEAKGNQSSGTHGLMMTRPSYPQKKKVSKRSLNRQHVLLFCYLSLRGTDVWNRAVDAFSTGPQRGTQGLERQI